jgi:hypothetical protein
VCSRVCDGLAQPIFCVGSFGDIFAGYRMVSISDLASPETAGQLVAEHTHLGGFQVLTFPKLECTDTLHVLEGTLLLNGARVAELGYATARSCNVVGGSSGAYICATIVNSSECSWLQSLPSIADITNATVRIPMTAPVGRPCLYVDEDYAQI